MNLCVFRDGIFILGFLSFLVSFFASNRIRASWAKTVFLLSGILGIAKGFSGLVVDTIYITICDSTMVEITALFNLVDGMLIGFILSLFLSNQLRGKKLNDVGVLISTR